MSSHEEGKRRINPDDPRLKRAMRKSSESKHALRRYLSELQEPHLAAGEGSRAVVPVIGADITSQETRLGASQVMDVPDLIGDFTAGNEPVLDSETKVNEEVRTDTSAERPSLTIDEVRPNLPGEKSNGQTSSASPAPQADIPPMTRTRVMDLNRRIDPLKARAKELRRGGAVLPKDGERRGRGAREDRELESLDRQIKALSTERNEWVRIYDDADKQIPAQLAKLRAVNPLGFATPPVEQENNESPVTGRNPGTFIPTRERRAPSGNTRAKEKRKTGKGQQKEKQSRGQGKNRYNVERRPSSPPPSRVKSQASDLPDVSDVTPKEVRAGKSSNVSEIHRRKEKLSDDQRALRRLVSEYREYMSQNPFAVGSERTTQNVVDAYRASLTVSYITERLGFPLNELPHEEAVVAVLEKVFQADIAHRLNLSTMNEDDVYFSPRFTDKLFKDILFPDRRWEYRPYGFRTLTRDGDAKGITTPDIVRVVITPERHPKIAEGIQVASHFFKADEGKAMQDEREFARISGIFPDLFIPNAPLHLFAESRKVKRGQPIQLTAGEEVILSQPHVVPIEQTRRLAEDIVTKVLPGHQSTFYLTWTGERRRNAHITDSHTHAMSADRRPQKR